MGSEAFLLWGVVFGSVGLAYFVYGKKQRRFVPLLCGIALMAFPYFMSNTVLLVVVGLVLSVVPYFFRL
ncbi:MAG: hypothetical protein E6J54_17945 [Deltaproteobacteria bacterium]|nr:MAG: hypothetical protein E6J54_17945 [Deltaproteobacteria bacterium]